MKFNGRLLVIGCGSVAQCAIPMLLKHLEMPASKITILDFVDNRKRVQDAIRKGVHYVRDRITPENYKQLLSKYAGPGDMIIDLAWNIECRAILDWCRKNKVLYMNTSVEEWDPYKDSQRNDPTKYTLYTRQMELRRMIEKWGDNEGTTAVVDHGANPGLVSHFTKYALIQIAEKILKEKTRDPRRKDLERALKDLDFAHLAMISGVKVIHISERDTQITKQPKELNEFVNTWSIEGFYEEGVAPAELGWGTHEKYIPESAVFHKEGPKNQICLSSIGMKTWVRSWVPCGEITGMVIRHGEAFSISDKLTVWENDKAIYRPTVHYAYCPSDSAINSLHELEMRQFVMQDRQRIMSDEIIDGRDELGVLLMGHDFNSWWCGSTLDIHSARKLIPHQQATTMQVAAGVLGATLWMLQNPRSGVCVPDDLDHDFVIKAAMPYIKPFISEAVDWTPLKSLNTKFTKYDIPRPVDEDVWQFTTFLVDHRERMRAHALKRPSQHPETVKV